MKPIVFKNKLNGEKFICENLKDVRVIDGVEFLPVFHYANNRPVLLRKDILEKQTEKK
jgi:hypothetical protein